MQICRALRVKVPRLEPEAKLDQEWAKAQASMKRICIRTLKGAVLVRRVSSMQLRICRPQTTRSVSLREMDNNQGFKRITSDLERHSPSSVLGSRPSAWAKSRCSNFDLFQRSYTVSDNSGVAPVDTAIQCELEKFFGGFGGRFTIMQ